MTRNQEDLKNNFDFSRDVNAQHGHRKGGNEKESEKWIAIGSRMKHSIIGAEMMGEEEVGKRVIMTRQLLISLAP